MDMNMDNELVRQRVDIMAMESLLFVSSSRTALRWLHLALAWAGRRRAEWLVKYIQERLDFVHTALAHPRWQKKALKAARAAA